MLVSPPLTPAAGATGAYTPDPPPVAGTKSTHICPPVAGSLDKACGTCGGGA